MPNAIQTLNQVNFYNDVTRNARFTYAEVTIAVNDAIQYFIDEQVGDPFQRSVQSLQFIQTIRENLQPLIKTATIVPTNGTVITNRYYSTTPSSLTSPTDYYTFLYLSCLIDGYTEYSRPTNFNEKGPLFTDSFKHPTNAKHYFNETSTGIVIYRGVGGTFTSATLDYIKFPNTFSIGTEANLISSGAGVLTNGASYIATEISVHNHSFYHSPLTLLQITLLQYQQLYV
ncbi:hypothetical protein CCP3SC1AL1_510002 [Gammaproteobacteria bacterium]